MVVVDIMSTRPSQRNRRFLLIIKGGQFKSSTWHRRVKQKEEGSHIISQRKIPALLMIQEDPRSARVPRNCLSLSPIHTWLELLPRRVVLVGQTPMRTVLQPPERVHPGYLYHRAKQGLPVINIRPKQPKQLHLHLLKKFKYRSEGQALGTAMPQPSNRCHSHSYSPLVPTLGPLPVAPQLEHPTRCLPVEILTHNNAGLVQQRPRHQSLQPTRKESFSSPNRVNHMLSRIQSPYRIIQNKSALLAYLVLNLCLRFQNTDPARRKLLRQKIEGTSVQTLSLDLLVVFWQGLCQAVWEEALQQHNLEGKRARGPL